MRALVTGGSGFVGLRLLTRLTAAKALSRDPRRAHGIIGGDTEVLAWLPEAGPPPPAAFADVDVVFHLAGESIGNRRWSAAQKKRIHDSRVVGTRNLVAGMAAASTRPKILVCASAIGIYGDRGDEQLADDATLGDDFLAGVCEAWEGAANEARAYGVRVVTVRSGILLELGGGALAKMARPFKLGVGGRIGSGQQWMSWIHLDDHVDLMLHLANTDLSGAVNAVAPTPVRNIDFTRSLARALHRPALFPLPEFGLRLMFGEMAQGLLLSSQRVVPRAAQQSGYSFSYTDLDAALAHIFATTRE